MKLGLKADSFDVLHLPYADLNYCLIFAINSETPNLQVSLLANDANTLKTPTFYTESVNVQLYIKIYNRQYDRFTTELFQLKSNVRNIQ